MAQKQRQFCKACNQITTQVKASAATDWQCLCCESAKFRTQNRTTTIKKKGAKKPRLNLNF